MQIPDVPFHSDLRNMKDSCAEKTNPFIAASFSILPTTPHPTTCFKHNSSVLIFPLPFTANPRPYARRGGGWGGGGGGGEKKRKRKTEKKKQKNNNNENNATNQPINAVNEKQKKHKTKKTRKTKQKTEPVQNGTNTITTTTDGSKTQNFGASKK